MKDINGRKIKVKGKGEIRLENNILTDCYTHITEKNTGEDLAEGLRMLGLLGPDSGYDE